MGETPRDLKVMSVEGGGMSEDEAEARVADELARVEQEILNLERMMQPQPMSPNIRGREQGDVTKVAAAHLAEVEDKLRQAKDRREILQARLSGYAARRAGAREK
ncbi:hypothetical protein HYW17_01970 [Candidatus Uhrbacteria bacterium]|nr:hypothetical protein [Candidatus Uhrbacteria bacterium]